MMLGSWRDAIGAPVINVVDLELAGIFFDGAVWISGLDRCSSIRNRHTVKLIGRIWLSRMKLRIVDASKRLVLAIWSQSSPQLHPHDKRTFCSHPYVPIPGPEDRQLGHRRVSLALHQFTRKVLEQCRLQHPVFYF